MLKKSAKLSLILTACAIAVQSFAAPLSIEQQGSFAVGGTVKTSSGTYQPLPEIAKGKESNNFMACSMRPFRQADKPCTATTPRCFTKSRATHALIRWYSYTVQDNLCGLGRPHRTVVKVSKISFYAKTTLFI